MPDDSITITLPASLATQVPAMAKPLVDRMHELLERNTEGQLSALEKEELEGLVRMAEFAELVATAVRKAAP